jgi:hypothetical protein
MMHQENIESEPYRPCRADSTISPPGRPQGKAI